MKQPTLEEVKEYFKNAKTVKNRYGKEFEPFKIVHGHCPNSFMNINPNDYDSDGATLWEEEKGYAEILTYKEKTFSITESQIKELCSPSFRTNEERLKEWFPEVFESKIIPDTFWFHNTGELCLIFEVTKNNGGTVKCKHISNDSDNFAYHGIGCMYREAKEEEIREFLKKESIKRGFVPGCYTVINGFPKEITKFSGKDPARYGYYAPEKKFLLNNRSIFKNGKWAEIIQTITLLEAEQQLGKKIIV